MGQVSEVSKSKTDCCRGACLQFDSRFPQCMVYEREITGFFEEPYATYFTKLFTLLILHSANLVTAIVQITNKGLSYVCV